MSVKQVISLMATTPGADAFYTGVEYGVARESRLVSVNFRRYLYFERE